MSCFLGAKQMITRADITGALKLLHANNISDRRGHLQNMLAKEHSPKDVAKVLSDLESYPEWAARTDLDTAPAQVEAVQSEPNPVQ